MTAKRGDDLTKATLRKLKAQLGMFEQFLAARCKFFPSEITPTDVIEFRIGWTWKSGVTRQKAQQNLRGFLRYCCKDNLGELLKVLNAIKLSKVDRARLEPQPFTEEELKKLLAQVPKTIPDPVKAARMTALIHCQVATGLTIRETVQLERENIRDGWLRIRRQKTNKPVRQKLDAGLHAELIAVTNGNSRYVFWNGTSLPTSATGLWQEDLRQVMKDAGLWIKGNLSHRFRDTAVDFWLAQGWTLTDVADALGDTIAVVEKHYKSLESKRAEERLAKRIRLSFTSRSASRSTNTSSILIRGRTRVCTSTDQRKSACHVLIFQNMSPTSRKMASHSPLRIMLKRNLPFPYGVFPMG